MMSGDISDVSNTKIFCGKVSPDTQITVYSNQIKTTQKALPSAMILPVPKKVTTVVDMSKIPNFFEELNKVCQRVTRSRGGTFSNYLPVERCGSYRYTLVPNISSFKGLRNDIFDIDLKCIDYMSKFYSGENEFEFIVCILDQNAEYSPFAYTHPCTDTLFVPTRHYHTHTHTHSQIGNLPGVDWDHSIYTIGCESTSDNLSAHKLERPGMAPWSPRSISPRMLIKKWDDLGNSSHDNLPITVSKKEPIISNFPIKNWNGLKKLSISSRSFTNCDLLISVA
jgi:hypothetical protein